MFDISDNIKWWAKTILSTLSWIVLAVALFLVYEKQQQDKLKFDEDFGTGIQNHLLWSIKNECYYVKPIDSKQVYLVRVVDCDRNK